MWHVLRCGDDDLGVNELLVELAVLSLLVRGGHKSVALVLNPLPETELVLSGSEQSRLLLSVLMALLCRESPLAIGSLT